MRNKEKQLESQRNWYSRNKKKQMKWVRDRSLYLKSLFYEYKKTLVCERCGFNDLRALVFHHRNPKEKDAVLSQVWVRGWSWERTLKEIAKCEVLCANCHSIEHAPVNPHASNVLKG